MHRPEAEERQHEALVRNRREKEGDQYALTTLRPSSGVPSMKRKYDESGIDLDVNAVKVSKRSRQNQDVVLNRFEASGISTYSTIDLLPSFSERFADCSQEPRSPLQVSCQAS